MINITSKVNPIIGIYKITSPSNKVYIGQSVNVKKRWCSYDERTAGPHLINSFNKYGRESHIFEVIEECSVEYLNERETYWKQCELDKVNGDYSKVLFCELYDNGVGPRSEQIKEKISKSLTGKKRSKEYGELISKLKKGISKPEGFSEKLSAANTGKTRSEEVKQRMSETRKGIPNLKNRKPKPPGFGKTLTGRPKKAVVTY